MANTYTLIASNTLTSSAASVTFSSIPSTYTDLVLRGSSRVSNANTVLDFVVTINGASTSYSDTVIYTSGASTVVSGRNIWGGAAWYMGRNPGSTASSNTFGSFELYLPNYAGSTNKVGSVISTAENNSTTAWQITGGALLRSNTSAITSLTIDSDGRTFVSGSSFFLYGIKNS